MNLLGKVALSTIIEPVDIIGNTALGGGPPVPGGFLALPTNIGQYRASRFAVAPEAGLTVGYQLTDHVRASVGYTFIYWSRVARPDNQVDLTINPFQLPPGTLAGTPRPAFSFYESDYWAHGLNFGLEFRCRSPGPLVPVRCGRSARTAPRAPTAEPGERTLFLRRLAACPFLILRVRASGQPAATIRTAVVPLLAWCRGRCRRATGEARPATVRPRSWSQQGEAPQGQPFAEPGLQVRQAPRHPRAADQGLVANRTNMAKRFRPPPPLTGPRRGKAPHPRSAFAARTAPILKPSRCRAGHPAPWRSRAPGTRSAPFVRRRQRQDNAPPGTPRPAWAVSSHAEQLSVPARHTGGVANPKRGAGAAEVPTKLQDSHALEPVFRGSPTAVPKLPPGRVLRLAIHLAGHTTLVKEGLLKRGPGVWRNVG